MYPSNNNNFNPYLQQGTYPPQIPHRNNNTLIILLYVLIGVILLGTGFFLYLHFSSTDKPNTVADGSNPANESYTTSQPSTQFIGNYPETSTRYLVYDEISGKSKWELRIMRNEIYARHNYIFQSQDLIEYFRDKTGYLPKYSDVSRMLNTYEQSNIKYILQFENRL